MTSSVLPLPVSSSQSVTSHLQTLLLSPFADRRRLPCPTDRKFLQFQTIFLCILLTCLIQQPVLRLEIMSAVLSYSINISLAPPRSSQKYFAVHFINFMSASVALFRLVAFHLQLIKASVKPKYYRNAFRFPSGILTPIKTRSLCP